MRLTNGMFVDTAVLTAHWLLGKNSIRQHDRRAIPFSCCVHKSLVLGMFELRRCRSLVGPEGSRDGSSSRAEIQYDFPTAEVRLQDMHVSTVASLTRNHEVRWFAPLLTRWW